MLELANVDLRTDAAAREYVKEEVVGVAFARADGELISREGPNRYRAGDALITGSTGDRWSVSRERFDRKYEALASDGAGLDGPYRARPVAVLARQMREPFAIARETGGDRLEGVALDWLMQYAPGDHGVVENARFQQVYQLKADR